MFHMQYPNAASPNNDSFHRHFCPNLPYRPMLLHTQEFISRNSSATKITSAWHYNFLSMAQPFPRQETVVP